MGPAYARSWANQHEMAVLGGRTARQALDAGETPKAVWRAVWQTLDLPASER
ncbi:MAG: DUF3046 domain-containing protein [Nocardioidaceae bacterium]